jgi:hypothetical protein
MNKDEEKLIKKGTQPFRVKEPDRNTYFADWQLAREYYRTIKSGSLEKYELPIWVETNVKKGKKNDV